MLQCSKVFGRVNVAVGDIIAGRRWFTVWLAAEITSGAAFEIGDVHG
jgi:hypothetical protein